MLKGNKGEWSEIYVLLRLLADGKIYAADEKLNKINDICFPVLKIIRQEFSESLLEYYTGKTIKIYFNGKLYKEFSVEEFDYQAKFLLNNIKDIKTKSAFNVEETESFMKKIQCYKIAAPSVDKSDIMIQIFDINTGYSPVVGFSIKSELGALPTLLNAGKSTNFIFKVEKATSFKIKETNAIYKVLKGKKHTDVKGRINNIITEQGEVLYYGMENKIFKDNLVLIDSNMDKIIGQTLLYFYRDNITNCKDMVNNLELENPMGYGNINAYKYKFKKFLTAIALGMKPATIWDGKDEASGGYIVVTKSGNVLAYHIYNRNCFEEYLLNNTKYETASTSRHDFGTIYSNGEDFFIKLNLQIRFV